MVMRERVCASSKSPVCDVPSHILKGPGNCVNRRIDVPIWLLPVGPPSEPFSHPHNEGLRVERVALSVVNFVFVEAQLCQVCPHAHSASALAGVGRAEPGRLAMLGDPTRCPFCFPLVRPTDHVPCDQHPTTAEVRWYAVSDRIREQMVRYM